MVIDPNAPAAPVPFGKRSVPRFHSSSSGHRTPSSLTRSPSTRAFVPLTPILASPLITPVVASPSVSGHCASSTNGTGLNIHGVMNAASTGLNRRGIYSTAQPLTAPPTWFTTPPTPPRLTNLVTLSSTSHGLPLSNSSVRCSTGSSLSAKWSEGTAKSFSQPPKDSLYSSNLRRSLSRLSSHDQLPSLSQQIYSSFPGRRAKERTGVKFPVSSDPLELNLSTIYQDTGKGIFHVGSLIEDYNPAFQISPTPRRWSAKNQNSTPLDKIRKYHALMELLRTEAKYLSDLRALVKIYIQQLPLVTTIVRIPTTSYFSSSSAFNAVTKALPYQNSASFASAPSPVHVIPSAYALAQHPAITPIGIVGRRRSRSVASSNEGGGEGLLQRRLFSEEDIVLLSRNAQDLLDFHDRFVREIKEAIAPFGPTYSFSVNDSDDHSGPPLDDSLDRVIEVIMLKFINEAAGFNIYRSFCSTHTEACELVQNIKKQYPIEWAVWEKRCSSLIENMQREESVGSEVLPLSSSAMATRSELDDSQRADSIHPKRPRSTPGLVLNATTPEVSIITAAIHSPTRTQSSRLMFTDYLIKPVQRICKYHLLLDQLKVKNSAPHTGEMGADNYKTGSQIDILVARASHAMRSAVDSVNDDRKRHEYHFKSLLIASRMALCSQLSSEFLHSLGACLLAGALDVYHRPSISAPIKTKYMGVFLYAVGYLVLTKVVKGRLYEPSHWFPLRGFEIIDQEVDDPGFPYSFHLVGQGHHFRFAAACQKEKEVWIAGFRESIDSISGWTVEPMSNLRDKNKVVDRQVTTMESAFRNPLSLPTIESLSELEDTREMLISCTQSKAQQPRRPRTLTRVRSETKFVAPSIRSEATIQQNINSSPSRSLSRRYSYSSPSARSTFSPFLFEFGVRVSRCSSAQRQQVDQGLVDVFSDLCRDARSVAEIHGVDLFQLQKKQPRVIRRSATSMRPKSEHKLVSRQSYAGTASAFVGDRRPRKQKTWSDTSYEKGCPIGALSECDGSPWTEGSACPIPGIVPDYLPDSVSSSGGTSGGGSSLSSPIVSPNQFITSLPPATRASTSHAMPVSVAESEFRPKRSQSMVDNLRSFFSARTLSTSRRSYHAMPTSVIQRGRNARDHTRAQTSPMPTRKRTQSTPVVSFEQSFSSSSAGLVPIASRSSHDSQEGAILPAGILVLDQQYPREGVQDDQKTLHGKRPSFLKSYTRRNSTKSADAPLVPTRRRSLRDILHYFRSNSFTPITA